MMENFQKKIDEMQRKLNLINDDIEEIKNGRKSLEDNKRIKINKANAFLSTHNKRKNFLKNYTNSSNSLNYIHGGKSITTNSTNFSNLNNTGKPIHHFKKTNFNLVNTNIDIIPKPYYISNEINSNNMTNISNNDLHNNKKDLSINCINDYNTKKNKYYKKKNKSSTSTINACDDKNININQKQNISNPYGTLNHEKNEINDEIYKNNHNNNTLYQNYCCMKKNLNLNNINYNPNLNNFNNSQTLNNDTRKNNKNNNTFNNTIKNMNSFSSIKGNKKIKKIIVDKKGNNKMPSQNSKKLFYNEFSTKHNKKINFYNNNNDYNNASEKKNNNNHRTIDTYYNSSCNGNNLFYETDNCLKLNVPLRIKTRNLLNNNNNININNSKVDYIKVKDINDFFEDIDIKSKRSMSIENPKLKYPFGGSYKFNKSIKLNVNQNYQDFSQTNYYEKNKSYIDNLNYTNQILNQNLENKNNLEQIINDIIDITNGYNNMENKANMNNIIDIYKVLLYDMKTKNEFIYKVINLYNKTNNSNLNSENSESLLLTWNWIKDIQNKVGYYEVKKETENNEYKNLCQDIMKEYKLKNIQQLKKFIHKLCKKIDKNEYFLEGIKKILLP